MDTTEKDLREPWRICKFIALHPNIAFGITLSVHLFFVMVSVGLMIGGYSLFPVEFKALPLDLYSQPWVKRELAFSSRYSFPGQVHRQFPKQLAEDKWERSTMFSKSLAVLYDGEGSNVLTPDGLRAMKKIEDSLFSVPTYTHFCQLTQDRKCYPAMSILRFFDGTLTFLDPVFYDPEFKNIPAVIYAAYTNEITKDKFVLSLGKGSVIKPDQVHVSLIRSIIPFGAEDGWLNTDEREAMIQFINDDFQPLLDHYVEKETAFSFMYYEEFLMLSDAVKQGFKDMRLAGGSVVFIFLFILFHTRSLWVTSLSVFSIVCSFVETNLVYRVVLDFRYFGYFHVLVMFIILGIGADDLFVFWDAWKAAGHRKFPTLAHRLDATYRKSVVSMFVTSLTTMLAFLSSAQSPMLATMSFGIFSAMLVTLDYISVITFFPTIIVFYHVHFEKKPALCCLCCPGGKRKASGGPAKASTCCCLVGGGGGGGGGIRCEQVLTATTTTRDSHPDDTSAGAGGGGVSLSHSGGVASAAPGGPKLENCPQDGGRADVPADISQTGTVFRSSSNASRRSRSQNPQGATTTTADSIAVAGAPEPQPAYLDDTTEPTFLNLDSSGSTLPMKSPANRRLNNRQSRAGAQSTTSTANQYSDFGAEPTFSRNTSNNGNRSTTLSSSTPSGARSLNQYQDVFPSSPSSSSFADRNNSTSQLLPDLGPALVADLNATAADDEENTELAQPELRWLVRFFRDYYFRFVTHRVFRWVVLVGLLALIVVFSISAARLEPDDKQIGLFRENHPYTRAFRRMSSGFVANGEDYSLLLWMVWGLKEQDMSECHFSDYNCQGEQRFDQSFDASTRAAQISLVKLCDALYNFTDKDVKDFAIKRDFKTKDPLIFCFTKSLNAFLKADQTLSDLQIADGLPWNRSHISKFAEPVLEKMSNVSASSGMLNSSFTDYLDVPLTYWLFDGYHGEAAPHFNDYDTLIGEQRTEYTWELPWIKPPVLVGNKIKWIAVQVGLDLKYETLAYTHHMPIFDRWEKFMADQLKEMPEEMKGGFQTTAVAWHLLHIQQALVFNAVTGIILGIALCLPILIVSTCNVINGLLATLTICGVTACVVGVVPMCGWKLGVLVSLNMCLVVGLAVDYVVHLAEGYHMSKARDRHGRLKHALETMGISVFSGACTTLGASTFMLFSKIQFFYQFGIFMFCTIGFSLLFSLGLYVTVMGIVGPEGDVGDIRVPFRACVRRLTCRRKGVRIPSSSSSSEGGLIGLSGDADDDALLHDVVDNLEDDQLMNFAYDDDEQMLVF